jgi:hypothetical protein
MIIKLDRPLVQMIEGSFAGNAATKDFECSTRAVPLATG